MKNIETSVTVIGSGLIGLTMSCLLAKKGIDVVLVSDNELKIDRKKPSWGVRINAYNQTTEKILREIDIWEDISIDVKSKFTTMRVLDKNDEPVFTIKRTDYKEEYIGTFIDNNEVIKKLIKKIKSLKKIKIISPTKAISLQEFDDQITIETDDGNRITSKILIGADGPNSWVREQSKFQTETTDLKQQCIVGVCEISGNHMQTAWQKFIPEGTIGLLPLSKNFVSLAFSTCKYKEYKSLTDNQLLNVLNTLIPKEFGKIIKINDRQSYPLFSKTVSPFSTGKIALIGDSAHSVHPLAGVGANLGFIDCLTFNDIIDKVSKSLESAKIDEILSKYDKERRSHSQLITHSLNAINDYFRKTPNCIQKIVNPLISVVSNQDLIKNSFVEYAKLLGYKDNT